MARQGNRAPEGEPPAQARLEAARSGSLAWGFSAFFLGYGGYYLVSLVVGALLPERRGGFDPASPPELGPLLLVSFAPNVVLGLLPAVFSWRKGRGLRSDFGILPNRRDLWIGIVCGSAALFVSLLVSAVLIGISGPPPDSGIEELLGARQNVWLFLFALFALVGAPLTEELLMRGALWGALEHYRVPRFAILLLTALLFALIHEEAWRLPVLFCAGLGVGAARMITGRVGASIVAHATNNFLPALVIFFGAG